MSTTPPVVLIRGGEAVLVREHVSATVDRLVADGDHAMMVDDLVLPLPSTLLSDKGEELAEVVGAVVSAASTPPFLTDRRVVVVRGCGLLSTKEDVAALVRYLDDPLPTTSLLLVWDLPHGATVRRSNPPKSLLEAVAACGGVVDEVTPSRKTAEWVRDRLKAEQFRFDAGAVDLVTRRVGDDPDVLIGYLTAVRGNFAAGDRISAEDLEPLLVDEGGIPPWDLTDAIQEGDPRRAVNALQRMLGPGDRHPLQVMATLTTYVTNLLALDGAGVTSADQAAKVLGGSAWVAKKAFTQSKRLGSERIADLVQLVAAADLDLRGRGRLPDYLVMEILVARMASRSAATRRPGSPVAAGGSRRR